jgi:hypothetical protein
MSQTAGQDGGRAGVDGADGHAHGLREPVVQESLLLEEVIWWQTDDFWQDALFAAVACIRAAASRAGVPVHQACHDLAQRPGCPAS